MSMHWATGRRGGHRKVVGARGAAKGRLRPHVAEAELAEQGGRSEGAAGVDAALRWRRAAEGGQHHQDEKAKRELPRQAVVELSPTPPYEQHSIARLARSQRFASANEGKERRAVVTEREAR